MTLLVRDEADIVDAHIAFHLNAGVEHVIATDHRSQDGTTEILERYQRDGFLHLIREQDLEYREVEWRTRMARLAATDFDADWVINSDVDEFWWPRGADLKEVLMSLPPRYGIVSAFWRPFVPRPDDESFFAERMTVRLSPGAAINNPSSQFRPNSKIIHRAHPSLTVSRGNHAVEGTLLQPLRGWYPVELFHFPLRSKAQLERKASIYRASEGTRLHEAHRALHDALEGGTLDESYGALLVDDDALERGLAEGSLVLDTRLRDALRVLAGAEAEPLPAADARFALPDQDSPRLRFPRPSVVEDAAYAVEAAVLGEADAVRLQRRLDELERRLALLEGHSWRRLGRRTRQLIAQLRPASDLR
jgi:tetrahydromethanopterin S-methyltransferase subunit G